ncbi:hypothetical protein [Mesorhizobium sp. A556]
MSRQFTHSEMADEIAKLVWSKQTWLDTFSTGAKRRPEHDLETRQRELGVLQQAEAGYRNAAERKSA